MQILHVIVQWVPINMMDNLSRLGICDLPVFPFSATALGAVSQPMASRRYLSMPVCSLHGWACWIGLCNFADRANHFVAAPHVLPIRDRANFLEISEKRVAVLPIHLVVPPTHLLGNRRPIAMDASATDDATSPSIVRRPMLLQALVVHQAKIVSRVLSLTAFNRANPVLDRRRHKSLHTISHIIERYKAIGNSMAVNCMRWIGQRIAWAEAAARDEAA